LYLKSVSVLRITRSTFFIQIDDESIMDDLDENSSNISHKNYISVTIDITLKIAGLITYHDE
jgi:hypothetical protein